MSERLTCRICGCENDRGSAHCEDCGVHFETLREYLVKAREDFFREVSCRIRSFQSLFDRDKHVLRELESWCANENERAEVVADRIEAAYGMGRREGRQSALKDVETILRQQCTFAGRQHPHDEIVEEVPGLKTAIRLVKEMADGIPGLEKEGANR